MHFAFPPRKTSNPPPYAARSTRYPLSQYLRRSQIRKFAIIGLGIIAFVYFIASFSSESEERIPPGTPPAVIVTVFDPSADAVHTEQIKRNRISYAKKHGYETFFALSTTYDLGKHTNAWSKIPAMRHALTSFPHSTFFWYLDAHSLIMNTSLSLHARITSPSVLEPLMIRDVPVVPPDSVIKSFSHLRADDANLIIAQDAEGLRQDSFILRSGDWAKFFLDSWMDPLYRSYNFQKADAHALEHLVQWHGTVLAKLVLVPQRTFNSFTRDSSGKNEEGLYKEGDFVANFMGCDKGERNCEDEMKPFLDKADDVPA
ncbi:alpha-1,6-mannosyltransferase subunit [Pseudovirgaria hyperparasitica]|uniref:Alpha-1,6-mannosyltransferase subunit n=1 Tax=Pseudovirgaria hyperparasitica TaxID=470096 RepID=A0A6A6WDA6_9PEZI|nr:alpha-1,6-mannosyltransferase subunit [Pseudovirgaria hyperparasitica]KAF2760555.1 alpha-1,6-mannosyltransferase subunit [Pseudovirgaria hyperparasitica]